MRGLRGSVASDHGPAGSPGLARTMGGVGALLITLSGLSPSIGVFVVGSDVIHQAGTAACVCFIAAALLGVAIANVYAELASAFPETGGEYTIVGRVLGPGWGFAMLGLNLLTFSIAPAMTALGVVTYLQALAHAQRLRTGQAAAGAGPDRVHVVLRWCSTRVLRQSSVDFLCQQGKNNKQASAIPSIVICCS